MSEIPILSSTTNLSPAASAVLEKINSRGGNIGVVNGMFGDMEGCDGIVEERIEPPQGGLFTKAMGCPFLFKSFPDKRIVEGLAFGKSMISLLPRRIISPSYFWKVGLLLRYVFSPTRFWHDAHILAWSLQENVVSKLNFPRKWYNKPVNVLREATDTAFAQCLDYEKNNQYTLGLRHGDTYVVNKYREIWETIACFLDFVLLFLEFDNAYRFRLQDVLPLVNKDNVRDNVVKEVSRLFDILIEREDPTHGIEKKWKQIRRVVIPLLRFDGRLRKFTRLFLLNLKTEEFKLDEADRYFCLRRRSHNVDGTTLEERLKEKERIDKEKGIVPMQLVQLKNEKGETGFGIKFL